MGEADQAHALDHTVVLMLENRSFDNLLGYLYAPGEIPTFEGIPKEVLWNPIPSYALGAERRTVPVHAAVDMDTPDPDPGEEYPHVNTQLFGSIVPESNRFVAVEDMKGPFNAPTPSSAQPTMDGFVTDYINTFRVEMGRLPRYDEYSQIMGCYTPDQVPVISALARGFATFDHWFCEVPSQTYCNRSFLHAATSSGFVTNGHPAGKFARENGAETVFERLQKAGLRWKVYVDPRQLLPATGLIHGSNLVKFGGDHFSTIFDFYEDARKGDLPEYSFIEPNMFHPHTDMHPPGMGRLRRELHLKSPNAMTGGELLLARVYNAIRNASTSGSNWANTLLLVTFDEHGGTYDHVPPPRAAPPNPAVPPGEQGFRFDVSGVRVPTVAISAWVEPRTVISGEYRHTSVIRTLREKWPIGGPLTQRDANAADMAPLLVRKAPRPPEEWPQVKPRALPPLEKVEEMVEEAFAGHLFSLEKDLVREALWQEATTNAQKVDVDVESLSRKDALRHMKRVRDNLFPGISRGLQS